ncbi:MAG: glycine cleavage system aminomethyltransferase GcvT [Peptococcaceae bacterium]|nr:glycine cleavage system aminomethyltransferase GcvT [Peptococcaceae bacterium]
MQLKTPLYECHKRHKGKMVEFAGYLLPVQYEQGVIKEHLAVREKCGLFDVSHMTELFLEGEDALKNIQKIFANDFAETKIGQVKYTTMLNEDGGIVDDMVIYKFSDTKYMVVGNAANHEKDYNWIKSHLFGNCTLTDRTNDYAQLALQGPASTEILKKLTEESNIPAKYYTFLEGKIAGLDCIISQTGYTGELGYELYTAPHNAVKLWDELIQAGKDFGLIPCGLGARDTLRLEAAMPLYGHEMTDDITPLEAKLNFSVKLNKEDFIGKTALEKRMDSSRVLAGFKITGKGIVREQNDMFIDGKKVGFSTSGTHAPYFGYPIALGYIDKQYSAIGTKVIFKVRGREVEAEVTATPFYKRSKK